MPGLYGICLLRAIPNSVVFAITTLDILELFWLSYDILIRLKESAVFLPHALCAPNVLLLLTLCLGNIATFLELINGG